MKAIVYTKYSPPDVLQLYCLFQPQGARALGDLGFYSPFPKLLVVFYIEEFSMRCHGNQNYSYG